MGKDWTCPVCGTSILARTYRKPLQGKVTLPPRNGMTVVGYRCQKGHICLASEEPVGKGDRSVSAA